MRHRLEDLGRLAVLLEELLKLELFSKEGHLSPFRNKDYHEWFASKSEDQKDDTIRAWVYGIDDIRDKIYEMLSIAEGKDELSEFTTFEKPRE